MSLSKIFLSICKNLGIIEYESGIRLFLVVMESQCKEAQAKTKGPFLVHITQPLEGLMDSGATESRCSKNIIRSCLISQP